MRDGLVEPAPGRGWRFADVGPATIRDSYRFRMLVEPAAILCDEYTSPSTAIGELDAAHAAVLDNLAGTSRRTLFDLDARFHVLVASGAGSEHLVQALERQNNIRRVHEYIGAVRLDRIRDSMLEHRRIMAALLRGERQMAAALMRLHLQVSEDETFQHMDSDLEAVRAGSRPLTEHRASEQGLDVDGIV
jgi:DNA-binding GntR family transcriptional regulator